MRLVTYRRGGARRIGVVEGDPGEETVRDLSAATGLSSVRALIEAGPERFAEAPGESFPLSEATPDLPVHDPAKILCVGVNYLNRNEEYADASPAPEFPSLFMRTPLSFVPQGAPLIRPPESEQFDYEGEIVLVIGKGGRRIPEAEAHGAIAGLTLMNEGSVRDWLRHGKFNVTQGKNFDRSGALGPWVETDLGAFDLTDMRVETRVNGELRQSDTTANMAFPFAKIIAYISTFATLLPGDLIATGTPVGAGARFDPPKWLRPGDVVEVSCEGLGTLRNVVADEGAV